MASLPTALLPTTSEEFRSPTFWDGFFVARPEAFEWFIDTEHTVRLLAGLADGPLLHVGCGNSDLGLVLAQRGGRAAAGHRSLNVDNSPEAVKLMRAKAAEAAPPVDAARCAFEFADCLDMASLVPDGAFPCAVDKGLFDALIDDASPESRARAAALVGELRRCLSAGGTLVVVSLLQEHVRALLGEAAAAGWRSVSVRALRPATPTSRLQPFAVRLVAGDRDAGPELVWDAPEGEEGGGADAATCPSFGDLWRRVGASQEAYAAAFSAAKPKRHRQQVTVAFSPWDTDTDVKGTLWPELEKWAADAPPEGLLRVHGLRIEPHVYGMVRLVAEFVTDCDRIGSDDLSELLAEAFEDTVGSVEVLATVVAG